MDFKDLVKERYSSRAYTDAPVSREDVELILEAGRMAPTAKNNQPVKVLAVTSPEGLAKVSETANLYGAPLALVVCADRDVCWTRGFDGMNTAHIDATIATTQMMYQAADLGLGSVWICWFDPAVISAKFGLPENVVPVNILAIGHRDDTTSRNHGNRKPMDDFAEYA